MKNKKAQIVNVLTVSVAALLILIGFISIVIDPSIVGLATKGKVDKELSKQFDDSDEVDVIVFFKENGQYSSQSEKKEAIKQKRDAILETLDYEEVTNKSSLSASSTKELKLKHRYDSIGAFSGKITKSALTKLQNDPNVAKIVPVQKVHASLTNSVPHIGANQVWDITVNSQPIRGAGQT
ncbi:MAG TPA: protease inhibitor I9 family protein, partial [Candidatus Nanoarchaeia archaeon]|nr:protease inhibitor I9 family protein [Candidatus Nanoarchaeia archaeon]